MTSKAEKKIETIPIYPGSGSLLFNDELGVDQGHYSYYVTKRFEKGEWKWVLDLTTLTWNESSSSFHLFFPCSIETPKKQILAFCNVLDLFFSVQSLDRNTLESNLIVLIQRYFASV